VLHNTNARVAFCLDKAFQARWRAETAVDHSERRFSRLLEGGWIMLSHSEEFTDRLGSFCANQRCSGSAAARTKLPGPDNADHNSNHLRNELIAIVDDDQWAREGLNSFVASLGYLGVTFVSAEEYLESKLRQCTQCLILDVHLSGMSGPDLQTRLLADGYRTPVIFVTALFEERVRNQVMGAGAFGYLTKPCDEGALINCLENAVGKQRSSTIEARS
jgi:CheY-like chemotaxis protein